jgi:hypothetical protein
MRLCDQVMMQRWGCRQGALWQITTDLGTFWQISAECDIMQAIVVSILELHLNN